MLFEINNRFLVFLFLSFTVLSCKSQKNNFYGDLDNVLTEYIHSPDFNSNDKEKYLNSEVKLILVSRKDFFSKINLEKISEMYLIEILNPEMPSDIYTAYLKVDATVHLFRRDIDGKSKLDNKSIDVFKKEHRMESCLLLQMEETQNNDTDVKDNGSFHFKAFLTKIKDEKNISTHIPNEICI